VSLFGLAMSPAGLCRLEAARLGREAHEAVYGEDTRLRRAEVQPRDGREKSLGRFKRACFTLRGRAVAIAALARRRLGRRSASRPGSLSPLT
jgi:hypothetical protein